MNDKRRAFVREYLIDLNATQAAIRAGYSPKTARAQGHRLLTDADIQGELQTAQAKRAEKAALSAEWVLARLRIEAEGLGPDTTPTARVRAAELLGKHLGMFTERQEITLKRDPREMSKVELEEYLRGRGLMD